MFLIPRSWYEIKKIKEKGRGIFANHDIEAGTVVADYLGKIMRPGDENENRYGLYTMLGGVNYDILGNPHKEGAALINHSCANNCGMYPYGGHILLIALRKIFKGEEISIHYSLYAPDEKETTCDSHACYCESRICVGTMHDNAENFESWDKLRKENFGIWYKKIPGKYGSELKPLSSYPATIKKDYPKIYNVFGSEKESAKHYTDKKIPKIDELRKRIRETGQQLSFPKLHLTIYGIRDDMLIAKLEK
jgi:SET domain-containing protein